MTIAFTQQGAVAYDYSHSQAALSVSLSNVYVGSTLVIFAVTHDTSVNTVTCPGNTVIAGAHAPNANGYSASCFIVESATGGTMNVTISSDAANLNQLYVAEIRNTIGAGAYLGGSCSTDATSGALTTDLIVAPSFSIAAAPAMLFGLSFATPDAFAPTPGTGFSGQGSVWGGAAQPECRRVASSGSVQLSWSPVPNSRYSNFWNFTVAIAEGSGANAGNGSTSNTGTFAGAGTEIIFGRA